MNPAQLEFGIAVIMVHLFHFLRRYIPWIERETNKALQVVSLTVAVLSAAGLTFGWHRPVLQIEIDLPVVVRFLINGAVQHGMSQIYAYIMRRPISPSSPSLLRPVMAGPMK